MSLGHKLGIWDIGRVVGVGVFGVVCDVSSDVDDELRPGKWVIKYVRGGSGRMEKIAYDMLYYEKMMYFNLNDLEFIHDIPKYRRYKEYYGEIENCRYLVVEKMDLTLEDYFEEQSDFRSVINIGINLMSMIKILHSRSHIANDLKPDNIMFKNGKLCFVDLGMFVVMPSSSTIFGNIKYAGFNILNGNKINYRDDVEAILFIIIDQICPLPWIKGQDQEIYISRKLHYDPSKNNLFKQWLEEINLQELYEIFQDLISNPPNYNHYIHILNNMKINF